MPVSIPGSPAVHIYIYRRTEKLEWDFGGNTWVSKKKRVPRYQISRVMLCGGVRSSKMMVRWRVRYVGYGGTVRWVQWVRYGGYGTVGTVGTVQWVRWVRYSGYGTVGAVVRYGGYGGYGAVGAYLHAPYRTHRTHRTVPTVPTVPYPLYRTHRTHRTVPTVPTVPYPLYPPYRTHRKCQMYLPVLNHQKTCFSFLLKLDKYRVRNPGRILSLFIFVLKPKKSCGNNIALKNWWKRFGLFMSSHIHIPMIYRLYCYTDGPKDTVNFHLFHWEIKCYAMQLSAIRMTPPHIKILSSSP